MTLQNIQQRPQYHFPPSLSVDFFSDITIVSTSLNVINHHTYYNTIPLHQLFTTAIPPSRALLVAEYLHRLDSLPQPLQRDVGYHIYSQLITAISKLPASPTHPSKTTKSSSTQHSYFSYSNLIGLLLYDKYLPPINRCNHLSHHPPWTHTMQDYLHTNDINHIYNHPEHAPDFYTEAIDANLSTNHNNSIADQSVDDGDYETVYSDDLYLSDQDNFDASLSNSIDSNSQDYNSDEDTFNYKAYSGNNINFQDEHLCNDIYSDNGSLDSANLYQYENLHHHYDNIQHDHDYLDNNLDNYLDSGEITPTTDNLHSQIFETYSYLSEYSDLHDLIEDPHLLHQFEDGFLDLFFTPFV